MVKTVEKINKLIEHYIDLVVDRMDLENTYSKTTFAQRQRNIQKDIAEARNYLNVALGLAQSLDEGELTKENNDILINLKYQFET